MSRLIFEGDIFNSLGAKHPTVYFSNVSVLDDMVTVELNCFAEEVVLRYMMTKLKLYLVPIYKDSDYQKIISDPDNLVSNIYDLRGANFPNFRPPVFTAGTITLGPFGTITPGTSTAPPTTDYFLEFLIDKFEPVPTRNYNANDNQYFKLIAKKALVDFDDELYKLNYLSFVVFTSYLTPEEIEDKAQQQKFNSFTLDEVSNISFCRTVVDRLVVNEPFQTYLNGEKEYHGPVLENLNGAYRANNLTEFKKLLANIKQTNQTFANSEDQQLKSFVDSSSFIVETQKAKVDFLTQMKSLIDSFPRRTNLSSLGVFHTQLKELIFSFNDFLSRQLKLDKKIVTTNFNFDFREVSQAVLLSTRVPYTSLYSLRNSTFSSYNEEFIYIPFMDRTRRFPASSGYTAPGSPSVPEDVCYNHSFFFFDYEKALYKTSNISQIFNVDEINLYFGNNCLAPYFQFSSVAYGRLHENQFNSSEVFGCVIEGTFNNINYNSSTRPAINLVLNVQQRSIFNAYTIPQTAPDQAALRTIYVTDEENPGLGARDGEQIDSLIAQRNFDTIRSFGDYKLACFEVSDIQTKLNIKTAYKLKVEIKDYTINFVIDQIILPAQAALRALEDYYDLASDFCSYNDLDNKFNDFFIESIGDRYATFPRPPWERGPIWYHILANLETKSDIEATSLTLLNKIQNEIFKISPTTGNLDNIELFIQRYKDLLSVFEEGGTIYEQIYGGTRADGTPLGNGLIDNIDTAYVRNFEDLPGILDRNVLSYEQQLESEGGTAAENATTMSEDFNIRLFNNTATKNSTESLQFIYDTIVYFRELSQSGTRTLDNATKIDIAFQYMIERAKGLSQSNFIGEMKAIYRDYVDNPNERRGDTLSFYRQRLSGTKKDFLRANSAKIINLLQHIRILNVKSKHDPLKNISILKNIIKVGEAHADSERLESLLGISEELANEIMPTSTERSLGRLVATGDDGETWLTLLGESLNYIRPV